MSKATVTRKSIMDTVLLDLKTVKTWKLPPFQRPLRVNDKVRQEK